MGKIHEQGVENSIMIKISYNISINRNTNNIKSVLISSDLDCDGTYKSVLKIINNVFVGKSFMFKAIGLPGNINDIIDDIDLDILQYNQGDSNKFLIRRYPECIVKLDERHFSRVLTDYWSSAITETRRIYIYDEKNTEKLINVLDKYKYVDKYSFQECWQYIDAIIENIPECSTDSFTIIYKEYLHDSIVSLLNQLECTGDGSKPLKK